jgi:hypothetical protein
MNRLLSQKLKSLYATLIAVSLASSLTLATASSSAHTTPKAAARSREENLKPAVDPGFGKLPLSFEPNRGQAQRSVKFLSRGSGYLLTLSSTQATLALHSSKSTEQLRMKLIGSDPKAKVSAESQLEGVSNYLIGRDKTRWRTNVPNYSRVRVTEAYPGIDVLYYGSDQQRLEFDFIVKAGADPNHVRLNFEGAESLQIDQDGGLRLKTKDSEIVQPAPTIYQVVEGNRKKVDGCFVLSGAEVKFELGEYDHSKELVIDPQVIYASFHGGNGDDRAEGIAVDKNGNVFVVGSTLSTNLNVTGGLGGDDNGMDAFIVKINSTGSQRVFSTYLGGNGTEFAGAVAVTSDGKACVTGGASVDTLDPLPTTSSRYQGPNAIGSAGLDVFVTVLTTAGDGLVYSTFIGGNDNDAGRGIAVDQFNKIYVSGFALSPNFPRKNSNQGRPEGHEPSGFIAKIDPAESGNDSLVYSSVIHGEGTGRTDGERVAVTPNGVAFTMGTTEATALPVKSSSSLPPLQSTNKGGQEIYIAKVSTNGTFDYLTYFGGNGLDVPTGIAVDTNERVYLTGFTTSSAQTFPLRNAFDATRNSSNDTFIAKLNADGTALFYSTFFSPTTGNNQANAIAVDAGGEVYISGFAVGTPILAPVNGFQSDLPNGGAFVAKFERSNATGTNSPRLLYFDTFGSINPADAALDRKGNLYVAGTSSNPLPASLTSGVFQPNFGGAPNDAVVFKVAATFPDTIGVYRPSTKQFLLRNSNSAGVPDITRAFGAADDLPIAGDWNGDGIDDIGVFRPSTGQFILRVPLFLTFTDTVFINFGQQGDFPVVGDWDGDGIDTPGVFRLSTGEWFLTNGPNVDGTAPVNASFQFGTSGDLPIAGDFDGNGKDGIGVFRPSTGEFFLNNELNSTVNAAFNFGVSGDFPVAGDWIGDGADGVGVFRPSTGQFFLNDSNTTNTISLIVSFGQLGDMPIAGNWDGTP